MPRGLLAGPHPRGLRGKAREDPPPGQGPQTLPPRRLQAGEPHHSGSAHPGSRDRAPAGGGNTSPAPARSAWGVWGGSGNCREGQETRSARASWAAPFSLRTLHSQLIVFSSFERPRATERPAVHEFPAAARAGPGARHSVPVSHASGRGSQDQTSTLIRDVGALNPLCSGLTLENLCV